MAFEVKRAGEEIRLIITRDEDAQRLDAPLPDLVKTLTRRDALRLIRLLLDAIESEPAFLDATLEAGAENSTERRRANRLGQ